MPNDSVSLKFKDGTSNVVYGIHSAKIEAGDLVVEKLDALTQRPDPTLVQRISLRQLDRVVVRKGQVSETLLESSRVICD